MSLLACHVGAEEVPSTFDDNDGGFVDDGADFDDDDDDAPEPYDGGGFDDTVGDTTAGPVDAFSGAPTLPGAAEPLDFPLEMMAQGGSAGMGDDFLDGIF